MYTIKMPHAVGRVKNIKDATIVRWLKKQGDRVENGQALCQVQTWQGMVELKSDQSGVLDKIICPEGTSVSADQPIAQLAEANQAAAAGPVTPILMPQMGNTMEEGMIVRWCVQPGARINTGDIIFEVVNNDLNISSYFVKY